jgi:hypothetical protein
MVVLHFRLGVGGQLRIAVTNRAQENGQATACW